MLNLSDKILIYIQFCLKRKKYKFNYSDLKETLESADSREYSIKTLRKEFSILKSKGYIEHKLRYRKPYPVLTTEGKLKISSHLPYKKYDVWDGSWRVVCTNVPEEDRKSRIRYNNKLLGIGFKKVSSSTYISPHPLLASANRVATELGINQYCLMFESKKLLHQDMIVEKIWETSEIDKQYNNFIELAKIELKKQKNPFWPFLAKDLELKFKQIYSADPHLPKNFLSKNWKGDEAYDLFKKITGSY